MGTLTTHTEISNDSRRAIIQLKEEYISIYNEFKVGTKNISYAVAVTLMREFDEVVEKIHCAEDAFRSGREEEVTSYVAFCSSRLRIVQEKIRQQERFQIKFNTHEEAGINDREKPS